MVRGKGEFWSHMNRFLDGPSKLELLAKLGFFSKCLENFSGRTRSSVRSRKFSQVLACSILNEGNFFVVAPSRKGKRCFACSQRPFNTRIRYMTYICIDR